MPDNTDDLDLDLDETTTESNEKVEETKKPTKATKTTKPAKGKEKDNLYTYVGGGEDSPRVIDFMGMQKFVRGKAEEVTNPIVLAKIENNPCFTKGEVDLEELHEYDDKETKKAAAQRIKDEALNKAAKKKFGTE